MKCPKCRSDNIQKGEVSYFGCITDEDRYGRDMSWEEDGYKCNTCGSLFCVWEEHEYDFKKYDGG